MQYQPIEFSDLFCFPGYGEKDRKNSVDYRQKMHDFALVRTAQKNDKITLHVVLAGTWFKNTDDYMPLFLSQFFENTCHDLSIIISML
jgi:hypothetical protein